MPTIDELLNSGNGADSYYGEIFTPADGYERVIYDDANIINIVNKSIGDMERQISVEGEANSQYILFERERYADSIDLNDKLIQVHYEREDGVGGNSVPVNVEISDEHIRFGWIIPPKAVAIDGILKVMPFVYGVSPTGDTYILKDLYIEYVVHEGLAVSGGIEAPDEDWYLQFLSQMEKFVSEAKTSETNAKISEDNAKASENQAIQSAEEAKQYAENISIHEANAAESASAAEAAKNAALGSQNAAALSATNAKASEDNAASSLSEIKVIERNVISNAELATTAAENAQASAEAAATSADIALASQTVIEGISSTVQGNAEAAKESEEAAASSAENAKTSEINAKDSETVAAQYAQNAAESANNAADFSTSAENAASAASSSEMNAASSADTANNAAQSAENSATAAQTSYENAEESANNASNSASQAQESATNAETYATNAQESATNAAESADIAKQYSGNPAKPQNGTWWIWDAENSEYQDTGIKSVLSIVKSYPSIQAMEDDKDNMEEGDLVIIASNTEDVDNSKLYVHNGTDWVYLSDLSGLQGVGIANIERTYGDGTAGSLDVYTITLTDNREFTFTVYNGTDGLGTGDMSKSTYDTKNRNTDIFDYADTELAKKADLVDGKVPTEQLPEMDYIPSNEKGVADGVATLGTDGKVPPEQLPDLNYIPTSEKGNPSGVASLDANGKVPDTQLPDMDYEPSGSVEQHNESTESHQDIREKIETVQDALDVISSAKKVTGVKGNNETEYRTGDVNLTPENIGAIATDGDASNATITFEEATARANVQSGDTLATAFAKLSKFCSDLETEINDNKDRLVNGDFKVQLDGSTLKARRIMQNPDGSTSESQGYVSADGFLGISAGSVTASQFIQGNTPISNIYAPINNPIFTGTPKAPTPVSTSNDTTLATTGFVKTEIGNLIGGAPTTLDTLKEIADAIEEHKDVTDALNSAIGNKVSKSGDTMTGQLIAPSFKGAVIDSGNNSSKVYFNYASSGLETAGWLCAWNVLSNNAGEEIRAISPTQVKSIMNLDNVDNTHDKDKYVKGVIDQGGDGKQNIRFYYQNMNNVVTTASWFPAFSSSGADAGSIVIKPISKENLINTLGVNDKQNITNGIVTGDIDWNTLTTAGAYKIEKCNMTEANHAPIGVHNYGILHVIVSGFNNETRISQIYIPDTVASDPTHGMRIRTQNVTNWAAWHILMTDADGVKKSGDTMTGGLIAQAGIGSVSDVASNSAGKSGYISICTITYKSSYVNLPLIFHVKQRGQTAENTLFLQINNNTSASSVRPFTFTKSVNLDFWICPKTNVDTTNTWIIYGQKSEAYDDISVLLESNDFIERGIVEIKWSNDTTTVSFDNIPNKSKGIQAKLEDKYFNCIYTNGILGPHNYNVLTPLSGDSNGDGVILGGGALVMVGSGESASALKTALPIANTSEEMYISSDGNIHFYTNCQNIGNKIHSYISSAGVVNANYFLSLSGTKNWISGLKDQALISCNNNNRENTFVCLANGKGRDGTFGIASYSVSTAGDNPNDSLYVYYAKASEISKGDSGAVAYKTILMDSNGNATFANKVSAQSFTGAIKDVGVTKHDIYFNYSDAGLETANWLCAWNVHTGGGYEIRALHKDKLKSLLGIPFQDTGIATHKSPTIWDNTVEVDIKIKHLCDNMYVAVGYIDARNVTKAIGFGSTIIDNINIRLSYQQYSQTYKNLGVEFVFTIQTIAGYSHLSIEVENGTKDSFIMGILPVFFPFYYVP